MKFLYQIGVFGYVWAIRLAAVFGNKKAGLWVKGRKIQIPTLEKFDGKTVWIHCASLGEFEQGRPVIEAIKQQFPRTRIVLTFYSPSGFEVRKTYPQADIITYLPADTPGAAKQFFEAVKPDVGILVKYEFWQGFLHEAKRKKIPLFLISGIFRENMPFFKFYGKYYREGLQAFSHFFVQNNESEKLLRHIGIEKVSVCGDTRLDRVLEAVSSAKPIPRIASFKNNQLVWICGSTWPADDRLILPILEKFKGKLKAVLVPHDIHDQYISTLIEKNPTLRMERFSTADAQQMHHTDLLIMDSMGLLMSAYAYADMVYVGGGFGKAVHNTMEPAAYGVPIFFGPKHKKFIEIQGLLQAGAAECVHTEAEMESLVNSLLYTKEKRQEMGQQAREYVQTHSGATAYILQQLASLLA